MNVVSPSPPRRAKAGTCYAAAWRYLARYGSEIVDLVLVHGEVAYEPGAPIIPHAWCEIGEWVIDPTNSQARVWSKAGYYAVLAALPLATFSLKQAASEMLRARHYGPWGLATGAVVLRMVE